MSVSSVLHQCSGTWPRKEEARWWKPMRIPSSQVKRNTRYCHRPLSPTSLVMSSHVVSIFPATEGSSVGAPPRPETARSPEPESAAAPSNWWAAVAGSWSMV